MKSVTAQELRQWINDKIEFELVDVREQHEHDEFNIGGLLLPLGEVGRGAEKIATDKPVVVYCRHGIRSRIAIQKLQGKFPFDNLYNLTGGTEAWKKMV